MNRETAITQANLNRINQYTPQGSLEYTQNGTFDDGTPRYNQTQTYSPDEQKKYDQANQVATALGSLANNNISRVQDVQSKPFSFDGMAPMQTSVGQGLPGLSSGAGAAPQMQSSVGGYGNVSDTPFGMGGPIQSGVQGTQTQTGIADQGSVTGQGGQTQPLAYGTGTAGRGITQQGGQTQPLAYGTQTAGKGIQSSFNGAGPLSTGAGNSGSITGGIDNSGGIQNGLNYQGLSTLPGTGDFSAEARRVADSVYGQATSRLDPQFQQSDSDMRSRLAAQGISENSDAYRREMDNFNRSKTDAYNQANFSAQQAGGAEQSRIFGLAMGARQQGQNEVNAQGQFANAAQQQQYGQNANNAQFANAAQQQQYGQNLGNAQLNNSAQGQIFGMNQAQGQFTNAAQQQYEDQIAREGQMNNSAQQQNYAQTLGNSQFTNAAQQQYEDQIAREGQMNNSAQQQNYAQTLGNNQQANAAQDQRTQQAMAMANLFNQGQGQQFNQGLQSAQFGNAAQGQAYSQGAQTIAANNQAQDQRYQQALGNADLYNNAQNTQFANNQSAAGFQNQARAQGFNEQSANATLNNSARQQQIAESSYLRNLPLNEIAALLGTGGSVNNPQFQNVAQVGVAAPDYQGAVQNNYNAAMNQYNQQMQAQSQGLGSIFGTLGSVAGMAFSDRRLKRDIRPIGRLRNGLRTYAFRYIGSPVQQFGVMAQEALKVMPSAVVLAGKYLMVDYTKVYA